MNTNQTITFLPLYNNLTVKQLVKYNITNDEIAIPDIKIIDNILQKEPGKITVNDYFILQKIIKNNHIREKKAKDKINEMKTLFILSKFYKYLLYGLLIGGFINLLLRLF
jgi:hypothetical protein